MPHSPENDKFQDLVAEEMSWPFDATGAETSESPLEIATEIASGLVYLTKEIVKLPVRGLMRVLRDKAELS